MGEHTKISWCDHTFNPWEGCTKISPGCAHCYAETRNQRFSGGENWGKGAPRRRTKPNNWKLPLKWDRDARGEGPATLECPSCEAPWSECDCGFAQRKPRVFCASLADWLDDEVPIEWLADLLDLIRQTPNLEWLLLTKRPENWRARMKKVAQLFNESSFDGDPHNENLRRTCLMVRAWLDFTPPANVWIGTTVEDQIRADERIPILLLIPAKVRFLSCEPLLGPVDISAHRPRISETFDSPLLLPDWVICGGESGKDARPMNPDWARSLRDQCQAAGVSFFFKQWGEWAWAFSADGRPSMSHVGKHTAGSLLDGIEHKKFPTLP
jgi:protein gp37